MVGTQDKIAQWLEEVSSGRITTTELAERILSQASQPGDNHQADVDRVRRCGHGEVIYGSGKSPDLIAAVAKRLLSMPEQHEVLVTRVEPKNARLASESFAFARYDMSARTLRLSNAPICSGSASSPARVIVVTAGSTDLPVAREALETLDWMGVSATIICDVGVAGP